MAGLRTDTLVAVGAAPVVMTSALVGKSTDPTRTAARVVSGIGFLGADVILRDGLTISVPDLADRGGP